MENLILPTDEQVERAKKALDQFEDGFFRNLINGDSTVLAFLVLLLNQDKILGEVAEVRPLPFGPVSATADSIDRAVSEFRQLLEKLAQERGVETIVEYQEITRIISLAMGRSAGLNVTSDDCDLADADAGLREWYHHKDISYSPLVRDGKRAIQDAQESRVMIHNLTQKLWSAIQRRSPAMSEEEVAAILREGLDVPTADETPHEGTISADGLSWERNIEIETIKGDPNQAVFSEAQVPYSEVFAIGYHDIAMVLADERKACANLALVTAQSVADGYRLNHCEYCRDGEIASNNVGQFIAKAILARGQGDRTTGVSDGSPLEPKDLDNGK